MKMEENIKKKTVMNSTQKALLTNFLKENAELAQGKFTSTFTFKKARELWQEVTNILNSVPNGAKKDWKQWRKVCSRSVPKY